MPKIGAPIPQEKAGWQRVVIKTYRYSKGSDDAVLLHIPMIAQRGVAVYSVDKIIELLPDVDMCILGKQSRAGMFTVCLLNKLDVRVCDVSTEEDAKKIGEVLIDKCGKLLKRTIACPKDILTLVNLLPEWVEPWIRLCHEDHKFIDPTPLME